MEYIRKIDFDAIDQSGPEDRLVQDLFDENTGTKHCTIKCIKTPGGGGSPAGKHTHDVDQVFYIIIGTMGIEIKDKQYDCGPGSLIVFPAGIPHRNWNSGDVPTVHLVFNTPHPDPNLPFAKPVGEQ